MERVASEIQQLDRQMWRGNMIKDEFYLTLPSHSSLQEFPQNAKTNFKVSLPKLIRLTEGDWKVVLASILVPDPKNVIRSWLRDDLTLFSYTSYYAEKNNTSNKIGFETDVKLPHIKNHVDLSSMTRFSQRFNSTYTKAFYWKQMIFWMDDWFQ